MNQGLTSREWKQFSDLVIKANPQQWYAMMDEIKNAMGEPHG